MHRGTVHNCVEVPVMAHSQELWVKQGGSVNERGDSVEERVVVVQLQELP